MPVDDASRLNPIGKPRDEPMRCRIVSVVILAAACASVPPAFAATYDVDRTDDTVSATACTAAPNDCSLRGAIIAANANPGPDTINLPAGMYTLSIAGPGEDFSQTGDLDIRDDLTLVGAGAATTIIDGGGLDRVIHSDPAGTGITVTISGVTIQNGATEVISFVVSDGGAVRNGTPFSLGGNAGGTLTIMNSVIRDSSTPRQGGGIANVGTLVLVDTTVSGNAAGTLGGGIWQDDQGSALLTNCTVIGNHANNQSGGGLGMGLFSITADPRVTITGSTFSGNTAGSGGGIFVNRGTLTLVNSTLSGNSGGGFCGVGTTLSNCTVTGNSGGGIQGNVTVTMANTIVAGNSAGFGDCNGTITSNGYNLIQDTSTCSIVGDPTGNITGRDAQLGLLVDNGGPTQTHALLPSSPAIDAGNPIPPGSGGGACRPTDQRGVLRPKGVACDIGAYEAPGGSTIYPAPIRGGNTAPLTTFIYGGGFTSGATVKLVRGGEADIVGNPPQGCQAPHWSSLSDGIDVGAIRCLARNAVVTSRG